MRRRGGGSPDRAVLLGTLLTAAALLVTAAPSAHAEGAEPAGSISLAQVEDPEPVTFDDPLLDLQWYLDRTRTRHAWALTPGLSGVTIAVVDTGVDPDHPDLDGALWTASSGAHGYDYVRGSTDTFVATSEDWHGTAVAGVAAARADDGFGMAGVAPGASVMVKRIYASDSLDAAPSIEGYASAAQAIGDAAQAGADVILLTWGGTQPNDELAEAIDDAGVPVVAAAGNDGRDLSASSGQKRYPAAYQLSNLVTVAASDREGGLLNNGRLASNYGVTTVDLAAPGEDIVSLGPSDAHAFYEGTSFAAPQVAAALALGRSLAPAATPGELIGELLRTVRRTSALSDRVASGGELDVLAFLQALERPVCHPGLPPTLFEDVNRRSMHIANIDCAVYYGISQGVSSNRFEPARRITRGEMASFLSRSLRAAGYPVPEDPERVFPDIDGSVHASAIDEVAALGITRGFADGTYGPNQRVPRGQMTAFLVRTLELITGEPLQVDRQWFSDIEGHSHEATIRIARDVGITTGGTHSGLFEPDLNVSRAQMASFVSRMLDAVGRQGIEVRPL